MTNQAHQALCDKGLHGRGNEKRFNSHIKQASHPACRIIRVQGRKDEMPRQRRLNGLLEELNIAHLRKNNAYTLSGGERRRLEITRALVTNPSFILLDEPFSGIDPIVVNEAQEIIKELRDKGLGILLTDHNVRETLSITDRAYLIAEGRILISGTAEELINNPQARQVYLGEKFRM